MSLDFVIIISFAGIFVGIVLLLFSNDKKNISALYYLSNSYKEQKSKTILKLKKPYYETLADSKDVNSYDLRFYAQIIDLFFIIAVFLIVKFYDIEHYVFFSIIISILIFFFSIILWKQSIGQKFMHLKVYYWNGKVALDYRFLFLRYIFKYIFFPLSFITFLTSKMLIHDIILKTYEAPK